MTPYDLLAFLALGLAIGVNSTAVYLQRTRNIYGRFGKHAWLVHQIVISVFWLGAVLGGFGLRYSSWETSWQSPVLGWLIMAGALALFYAAVRQIGMQGLSNGNFFGQPTRKLAGVYNYLRDPIYVSYALWYVGLVLVTGKAGFIVMALLALVGLKVESYIERV